MGKLLNRKICYRALLIKSCFIGKTSFAWSIIIINSVHIVKSVCGIRLCLYSIWQDVFITGGITSLSYSIGLKTVNAFINEEKKRQKQTQMLLRII